ncbi:MAG: TonB-dependent receptor [Gammaproteobacteria bacterium]|nr:TonB-dependent receptor [Gammaproteobacteria bacterium]MDE0443927.1 TonB-dependent receptor [Gammaproteobacteria bacterium]
MSSVNPYPGRLFLVPLLLATTAAEAQNDTDDDSEIEEVVVTGTQIKGADIADALAVSVLDAEDIEALGFDDGADLLEQLVEQGSNFFNEAENISGGVNSARGDVGAFNLRNLGTGNTLVLLNGRRVVNAASYQTEEVGGSFVPVNTANSQSLPPAGLRRIEVLRDGASAIYGADAVAGVVNYVLNSDFEGARVRVKHAAFENIPRTDLTLIGEWGSTFNEGRTNLSVFAQHYQRDRVNSQDDPRWADSDFRWRLDPNSPWASETDFRNNSANSEYRQFDAVSSVRRWGLRGELTDSAGEFETYPVGDPRCQYEIGYGTCGGIDGQGTYRHNLNENRDLFSELERTHVFAFLNHEFDNGMESYTELAAYLSASNMNRHASASFSTVKLQVGAENYYNPLGPCGSPNRLPDDVIPDVPCSGVRLWIDNGRWVEAPRIVDNDGATWRFLQGFRGTWDAWDWDGAVVWSRAEKEDVTHNRISNILMQEALEDPTPAAYNPFSGRANTNIERALVDVRRDNETELFLVDFKASTYDIFNLPAGPVGLLAGAEFRRESFVDDRDPRLDGTIVFTDFQGDTWPYVSDVVNSSPTPDSKGDHNVFSAFGELAVPVHETLDLQLAMRYEDFSDVGNTTVGKIALGFRPHERLLLRGSWSGAFRAPNLVTINEEIVARQNTRTDWTCVYAADNGGDPDQDTLSCRYSTQRIAQGSQNLIPESSDNRSLGAVVTPFAGMTFTVDTWWNEKEDTIGLLGEENHSLLDLLLRINNGNSNCDGFAGNPAIVRGEADDDETEIFSAAGICPAGRIAYVDDRYANLDKRTIHGTDYGIYYEAETRFGEFSLSHQMARLRHFQQDPGGDAGALLAAQEAGILPGNFPVAGFQNLVRQNGNPRWKTSTRLRWGYKGWSASLSSLYVGDFVQRSLTLDDGTEWVVPSMRTLNAYLAYRFDLGDDLSGRIRLGGLNIADERAPLADRYFGYFADMHQDLGARYYVEFRAELE